MAAEVIELILPIAGAAGGASWLGTLVANKTDLANLKAAFKAMSEEMATFRATQHQHDKDITILKLQQKGHQQ